MFFKTLFAFAALATGSTYAQGCSNEGRFGVLTISPEPIVLGQEVTIKADFNCSSDFGITPVYTDYTLVVPAANNTGFQLPVYFARRNAPSGTTDTFTVAFDPNYFGFTVYPDAQYEVVLTTAFVIQTDSFGETLVTGSVEKPVSFIQPQSH
ncbi:hypothetical protein BT96DRAFT_913232 [Gymnopus androsaceus JB14]|uniref:Uncharacterized protein n=1 Tax=Gymnopus androsaceus JB14 TaxID=1447944 RepID=A0A6A4IKR2_9AGAR|nr:hypothetical protein BT96DRAFT_913232 [Gymnopus androsaceus JB14]